MNLAIRAENISKAYQLGNFGTGTLSNDLVRWMARVRGKQDPFLGIGETNDRTTKGNSDVVWSLKDINFDIEQGDAVGIIGRNGAGKSTLLKILSKVTSPTTGRVSGKGRVASLLEVGTGFHPELTGRENIYLNGAIMGMRKKEISRKFDEIVDFAGVERYLDTPIKRYSSGMYVRLAFAVAAHLESEILIVDEVLAVGDAEFQKKCLGKMGEVSKGEGRTVLFVSHNMGSIMQLCSKGIMLKNGSSSKIDKISNVVESYISGDKILDNEFIADFETLNNKKNYFTNIYCTNINEKKISDITFDQSIVLNFEFKLNYDESNMQIGIGLNDKYQNRIFTVLKPMNFFNSKKDNKYKGKVILPSNIIAPNTYSFTFALWTKSGYVFDLIENICTIKIHDSGTDLALYEGVDHGSVIINPIWQDD